MCKEQVSTLNHTLSATDAHSPGGVKTTTPSKRAILWNSTLIQGIARSQGEAHDESASNPDAGQPVA